MTLKKQVIIKVIAAAARLMVMCSAFQTSGSGTKAVSIIQGQKGSRRGMGESSSLVGGLSQQTMSIEELPLTSPPLAFSWYPVPNYFYGPVSVEKKQMAVLETLSCSVGCQG